MAEDRLILLKDPARTIFIEYDTSERKLSEAKERWNAIKDKIVNKIDWWNHKLAIVVSIMVTSAYLIGVAVLIAFMTSYSHYSIFLSFPLGKLGFLIALGVYEMVRIDEYKIDWRKYTKSGKRKNYGK